MKVLLDTCVYGGGVEILEAAGYDVIWAGNWPQDPGDEEILRRAYSEGRILITLDKDFGELAVLFRKPHCGIIRLVDLSYTQEPKVCMQVLDKYGEVLQKGAIVTAELDRLRFRPPDPET